MAKYEKWLGAGIGWMLIGNPIGSLLGFWAGAVMGGKEEPRAITEPTEVSEFEVNLMVLASYLIKIDGVVNLQEVNFTHKFLDAHFDTKFSAHRLQIFNHCLQKEYDLNVVCHQIRSRTQLNTRAQVVNFLFELALSDGPLNKREEYFIFKIAGYLNINDIDYKKIKYGQQNPVLTPYDILGVSSQMPIAEIRTVYRKLVLKFHPDRNKNASPEEKKKLEQKFQQVKEAYQKIKAEKG